MYINDKHLANRTDRFKKRLLNFVAKNGFYRQCKCGTIAKTDEELELFPSKSESLFGKSSKCKVCEAKRKKADIEKRGGNRKLNLLKCYNMTIEEYDEMLKQQNDRCKICKTDTPKHKGRFVVDHCHTTGKVRGLLCDNCNKGLGHFRDNTSFMFEAIEYLKENSDGINK